MGMKPDYYPRAYGAPRPRRIQPAVAPAPMPVPTAPLAQPEVPPAPPAAAPTAMPASRAVQPVVPVNREAARLGVIWSEILGAPRSRRPWSKQ